MPNTNKPDFEHNLNHPDKDVVTGSQAKPEIGYETSDVSVSGVAVFLASLGAFLLVFFVFCYFTGKVINNQLVKNDGPANKWNQIAAVPHKRGKTMESSAAIEQKQLQLMTQRFPTPRLQMDDGNQDLADMHQREDILLDHYTWVNKEQGVVRIPIEQAMQMIVQKGLPVAPSGATTAQDSTMNMASGRITPPLTNGFARTTYEQQQSEAESRMQARPAGQMTSSNAKQPTTVAKVQAGGVQ